MTTIGMHIINPGARRDLGSRSRMLREVITRMISGNRWVAETSRWTDTPLPGGVGGVSRCNNRVKRR